MFLKEGKPPAPAQGRAEECLRWGDKGGKCRKVWGPGKITVLPYETGGR